MSSIRSNKSSLLTDIAAKFSLRRLRRIRRDSNNSTISSSHNPHEVHRNTMTPIILRDPSATSKLLDAILESPGGRRSVSRLARTCRAFSEPSLNVLWRELDSLVPIIGLFPSKLLRRSRKPGLGLAKTPAEEDWKKILVYGERVRRITYTELSNNVSPSVFTIFEENRPRTHIFPHLLELSWKAESPAGLDRCSLFLSPELKVLELEISTRFPQINSFLADMCSRTRLTTFSYISPSSLPDAFTELLLPQDRLEKVALMAPGALSPDLGRWTASLPSLQNLQIDLTGRSIVAVEGFFDNIRPRSGDSTPSSVGSTDSGVFSGDEPDFSEIRKSALRLTGDLHSKGTFAQLQQVQLTGEVSNITVFLKHITSPLKRLDLVIEDPPVKADWRDLSSLISERFGGTLQSLRVTATGSSRFTELVRSTSRAEPPSSHLSLEHFKALPGVTKLEIDLPESVIFYNSDIMHLAKLCPSVEILRLCHVARFPVAPNVTLNGLAPLLGHCRRLHTLAIVVNAEKGSDEVLLSPLTSSRSLLRLHVGHSWVKDPLEATILLSHLAPHLENLKWFHERNRPGFIEANSRGWEKVAEYLPHLQNVRLVERAQAWSQAFAAAALQAEVAGQPVFVGPEMVDKAVDAIPQVQTKDCSVQSSSSLISRMVQAKPDLLEKFVEARPIAVSLGMQASMSSSHQAVDATPSTNSTSVDAVISSSQSTGEADTLPFMQGKQSDHSSSYFAIPSIYDMFSFAFALFVSYPLYIPLRVIDMSLSTLHTRREPTSSEEDTTDSEKIEPSLHVSSRSSDSDSDYVISPVRP